MLLWYGLSTSSSCLNSISDSSIVSMYLDKQCDQKLMIDLEWPYIAKAFYTAQSNPCGFQHNQVHKATPN